MNKEIKEILDYMNNYGSTTERALLDYITNLQEKLEVSQTNEETYRLEMQDITKILGLDECTLFDEVKKYATNLQQENERLKDNIEWWKDRFFGQQEYDDSHRITAIEYRKRIDKAVLFINENNLEYYTNEEKLLNILQNGSDVNE